jgi:hypothetical protein
LVTADRETEGDAARILGEVGLGWIADVLGEQREAERALERRDRLVAEQLRSDLRDTVSELRAGRFEVLADPYRGWLVEEAIRARRPGG